MPTKGAELLLTRWECVLLIDILEEYVEGKEESNEKESNEKENSEEKSSEKESNKKGKGIIAGSALFLLLSTERATSPVFHQVRI